MPGDSNRSRSWVSVADKTLIRRQKLRLALVNMAVLAVIWTCLSVFVYLMLVRQTNASVDARMQVLADQAIERGFASGDLVEPSQLGDSDPDTHYAFWQQGVQGGWNLVRTSIGSLGLLRALSAFPSSILTPERFFDVTGSVGSYRVMQVRVSEGQVFQVVTDIAPQIGVLRRLLTLLIGAGAFGVALTVAGGYSLGRWTLRPIMAARQREQEFVADVSHELRTPLSVMMTHLELLLRHVDEPLQDHLGWLEAIYRENKRMRKLVDDLLDIARSDAGAGFLEFRPVDLAELCVDVGRLYEPLMERGGLLFETDLQNEVCVTGDVGRLRQLLFILLDNAHKYTEKGTVTLVLRRLSGHCEISVRDTGPGIAPDLLARVTERFVRGDAARAKAPMDADETRAVSTGLGLAIAKRIVQAHGGRLAITSGPGKGTVVTVRLRTCEERSAKERGGRNVTNRT